MKKNKIISILTAFALMLCVGITATFSAINVIANEDNQQPTETAPTYDSVNGYLYNVEQSFDASPDSFEAWINLPETSLGGTIASNRINKDGGSTFDSVTWEVDVFGHFAFAWDDHTVQYTFSNSTNLFDGKWHHVALVRTDTTFTYYLDGEVEGIYAINTTPICSADGFNIGCCNRSWLESRIPFEGYIEQVTFYEGAITADQIKADMNNKQITKDNVVCDATILGNWYLGKTWTKRVIENSVEGGSVLNLHTQNKYLGVDYSFGEYDYTFVIIPDIQIMTRYNTNRANSMTKWIADNKEKYNIQFVSFMGDLSDSGNLESNYAAAKTAMDNLNNKVPYCFVPGNHDYVDNFNAARDTTLYNKYFPYSVHSKLPGFGGAYEEGDMENTYYIFNVGEVNYLVFNFEFRTRMKVLRWAGRVIEQYPEHRVIIARHDNLKPNAKFETGRSDAYDTTDAQTMFDALGSQYANVFMNLGGHYPTDDIERRVDIGKHGNKVLSMLIDGQGTSYKGNNAQDMILLCHVNESKKTINFVYYSPEKDKLWNIQNQFEYNFADALNPTIGA